MGDPSRFVISLGVRELEIIIKWNRQCWWWIMLLGTYTTLIDIFYISLIFQYNINQCTF